MTDKQESTEVDPYKYRQLISKEQRKFYGERIIFSTNGAGTTGHPHAKK